MSGTEERNRERLLDLLVARASGALVNGDRDELDRLLAEFPDVSADEIELAAAAADLAFRVERGEHDEPLPDTLRQRIVADAPRHLPAGATVTRLQSRDAARPRRWFDAAGWYAAAAMLLLAVVFAWPERPASPPPAPTLAEQREALMSSATDLVQVAWVPPEADGYRDVRGDVVWSNERQAGFLRLSGMPVNQPTEEQYQLWIVDPGRDAEPVDGGVFDIPAGSEEVIIPIDPKLAVVQPAAFAITAEKPGGVVVSEGPLLVVAQVEA